MLLIIHNHNNKVKPMAFKPIHSYVKKQNPKAPMQSQSLYITVGYRPKTDETFISVNIPDHMLKMARLKKGDRVEFGYDEDAQKWGIEADEKGRYTLTGSSKTGVFKFKYCEGLPLPVEIKKETYSTDIDPQKTLINLIPSLL